MRVLMSTTSGAGHWMPIMPVMEALRDAGHTVLVACPASAAEPIRSRGFDVRPFADVEGRSAQQLELFARAAETGDGSFAEEAIALGFGYLSPSAAMPGLQESWDELQPDLLVRDPAEPAGAVLAEQTATPSAIAIGGLLSPLGYFIGLMADAVNQLRSDHGLAPHDGPPGDELVLTATPATFDITTGTTMRIHRFGLDLPRVQPPTAQPPLVYATLGTEVMHQGDLGARLVQTISDAIDLVDARCILTVGSDPSSLVPVHERVDLREFAPHREVIPSARVVLSHGGAGTVQDAVHMGRPMVVLPQFADQFHNGERIEELGLGSCLVGNDQTPEAIARALETALEGRYDPAVERLADEAAALPPASSVVRELETLLN